MARQHRIDYPGAVHHVMNRGGAHRDIFVDDQDRKMFLELWSRAVARFDVDVVSYCLMDNHFHFLVISNSGQLSRALQLTSQIYTQRFNARYGRDGALFRGRFHSVLIDSDSYFERVARYIELNPAAAGLIALSSLETYKWSSYQYYTGRLRPPAWLSCEQIWSRYQNPEQFDRFVRSELSDNLLDQFYSSPLRPGVVLGSSDFARKVAKIAGPEFKVISGLPERSLDEIDRLVSVQAGCEFLDLESDSPGTQATARRAAAYLANLLTDVSHQEVADRYRYPTADAAGSSIRSTANSAAPGTKRLVDGCLTALGLDRDGHQLRA